MKSLSKNKRIYVRITEKDYKQLQELIKDSDIPSMSAYVISCIREKKIPDTARKELRELRNQLYKVGTNLNQIARLANTEGIFVKDLDQVLKEVNDTVHKINELIWQMGRRSWIPLYPEFYAWRD
ncbi:MAG: MobC family plasmid mobilization relaxosome protein [Ruminococcaceae bacterium]|nr:MobC family plasmid mobilization relaxosome protein [Oscillospiraceae bacterium]